MVAPAFSLIQSHIQIDGIRVLDGAELERYLKDISPEDRRQARELWRQYALQKDLIDFAGNDPSATPSPGRRLFGFRDGVYFERLAGGGERVIPPAYIRLNIDRFAVEIRNVQRQMMVDMLNKRTSPQDWYNESIRLMKLSYLATVMIAQGESGEFDDQEKSRWLLLILLFFLLHNSLVDSIVTGRLPINGKIPIYAGVRGAQITTIYEDFRYHEMIDAGYDEARRRLSIAEHCEPSEGKHGCVELANLGWVSIFAVIPIGEKTTCGKFCKCTIEYRRSNLFNSFQ